MRVLLAGLIVAISTPVFADVKLPLLPVEEGALGSWADDEVHCDREVFVTRKLEVKGAKFVAAHDCGTSDQDGYLAISRGNDSFRLRAGTVAYFGANMTDAPQRLSMLLDSLTTGTFADKSVAVVYRIDLKDANVCTKPRCGHDALVHRQIIVACTVPTGTIPTPRCAKVEEACAGAARATRAARVMENCVAPVLASGVLTVGSARYTFE